MPIIATIGDANIIGNTISQGNLIVLSQYSNLLGNLNVNQTANIVTLNVSTISNLLGNVTINGNTFFLNNTYFQNINSAAVSNLNTLGVIGQANLLSILGVTGQTNLLSTVGITGAANLFSTLTVSQAGNFLSTLNVFSPTTMLSTLNVSSNINTASNLSVQNWANLFSLNVVSNANLLSNLMLIGTANLLNNINVSGSNSFFTGTINVAGTSNINNALTVTGQTNLMSGANLFSTLNVVGQSNLVGAVGIQGAINTFSTLTVAGATNVLSTMNVVGNFGVMSSSNLNTLNVYASANLNQSLTVVGGANLYSYLNAASLVVPGTSNLAQLGVYGNEVIEGNLIIKGSQNTTGEINSLSNISTPANIIVGSNIISGAGGVNQGNVLMSGNLVVQGNIYFTSGALGTIGGLTLTTASNIYLSNSFSADANGNAYSLPLLSPFEVKGTSAFIYVSNGGNIKFQLPGTYVFSGFFPGDATILKVAVGTSVTDVSPTTKNYIYIQNFTSTDRFNVPLVVLDQSLYYYIDVYTDKSGSNLAPTYATLGSNSGTFVSVTPHGTFIPQALQYPSSWTNVIASANVYNLASVGIGTTNPQSNLSVNGSMALGSYGLTGVAAPSNSFIVSGIAGIGTSTPTANLYVVGNIVSTTNVTCTGFANVGSIILGGTPMVDINRNFSNVGTISSGIITSTQVALAGYKNIVYRRPIWGVGSRVTGFRTTIPYGASEVEASTALCNVYSPFTTITAATGATRTYRLYCVYTLYGATLGGTFKIRCYLTGGSTVDFTIQSNVTTFYQDAYSNEQTVSNSNNGYFIIRANPILFDSINPFNVSIEYLELQALDNY